MSTEMLRIFTEEMRHSMEKVRVFTEKKLPVTEFYGEVRFPRNINAFVGRGFMFLRRSVCPYEPCTV